MRPASWWCWALLCGVTLLTLGAVVTAAERGALSGRAPRRPVLLQLEQDVSALTGGAADPEVVAYGGAQESALLRQIAAATRATAQGQLECVRQQEEIIRLLEILARGRKEAQ